MEKIIFSICVVAATIVVAVIFMGGAANSEDRGFIKEDNQNITASQTPQGSNDTQARCGIKAEERIVRGYSLSGLVEPGQTVNILFGFYDCNEITREDIVAYQYAGNSEPIIKIVKGAPNDTFGFEKSPAGCWNIFINSEKVQESRGANYCIGDAGYRMLSLYEKDYR